MPGLVFTSVHALFVSPHHSCLVTEDISWLILVTVSQTFFWILSEIALNAGQASNAKELMSLEEALSK